MAFLGLVFILPASAFSRSPFLQAPFWDDGKAEVAVYEATRFHYGSLYPSKVTLYLVKEPFSMSEFVKSNSSKDPESIEAIKLSHEITTPTGVYTYHQMHSTFWEKNSGRLLKFSLNHHEACGSTFKRGVRRGQVLDIEAFTYWAGQAQIKEEIRMEDSVWLMEELPLKARLLVADDLPAPESLKLIPAMIHSKAGSFQPQPAQIQRNGSRVSVHHAKGTETLEFDPSWPHVLISWKRADGSRLDLTQHLRLAYWTQNKPGDQLPQP